MIEAISIKQVMQIAECDRRTVERRIKSHVYEARQFPSEKQNGKTFIKVLVGSLPIPLQTKWMEGQTPEMLREPQHDTNPLNPPCQGEAIKSYAGPRVSTIERTLPPQDHAAWYQSLKPEHLTLIEKRLAIIEGIGRVVAAAKRKNKTAVATQLASLHGINRGTYYRWRKAYEVQGLYGLRVKSFGSSRSKLSEGQKKHILSLIRFNPDCRDTRIWEYVIDEFPNNPVSGSTVKRYVRQWKTENPDVFEFVSNPDRWKNNYMLAAGSQSGKAKHFLHYVELDSTPADVMCLDGKRYTIIGGIDIYSRKAKCHLSPSSSGMGVAALIRSIIIDWGVPENFVRDNGKDYVCKQINFALENLDINAVTLPPFTPEGKPHIERFFRTMATCLFEEAAGYIGHNVADRKAIESRRTFAQRLMRMGDDPVRLNLMPEDLQSLIDNWIENVYHHNQHGGIKTTPENKAAQSMVPARRIENERALDILLIPSGTRTVGKKGISFERAFYRSPQFAGWAGKEVLTRRDIDNAGLLYVFDLNHNFICMATDSRIDGMTSADHKAAKKEQRRIIKEKVNAIEVLTESPMERRLRKFKSEKKLVGLGRRRVHSTQALVEAENAALERSGVKSPRYKTIAEQMDGGEPYHPEIEDNEDPLSFMDKIKIVINE